MTHKLKILSLNVQGLRIQNKRWAVFCYLKQQKATIFCLQETYFNNLMMRKCELRNGVGKLSFVMELCTLKAYVYY